MSSRGSMPSAQPSSPKTTTAPMPNPPPRPIGKPPDIPPPPPNPPPSPRRSSMLLLSGRSSSRMIVSPYGISPPHGAFRMVPCLYRTTSDATGGTFRHHQYMSPQDIA